MIVRTILATVSLLAVTVTAQAQDSAGIRAFSRYDVVPGRADRAFRRLHAGREFDVLPSQPFTAGTSLATVLAQLEDVRQPMHWTLAENRFTVTLHPSGEAGTDRRHAGVGEPAVTVQAEAWSGKNGGVAHVSISRAAGPRR